MKKFKLTEKERAELITQNGIPLQSSINTFFLYHISETKLSMPLEGSYTTSHIPERWHHLFLFNQQCWLVVYSLGKYDE